MKWPNGMGLTRDYMEEEGERESERASSAGTESRGAKEPSIGAARSGFLASQLAANPRPAAGKMIFWENVFTVNFTNTNFNKSQKRKWQSEKVKIRGQRC